MKKGILNKFLKIRFGRRIFLFLGIFFVVILSFLTIKLVYADWSEPTASPPDSNVPVPINVGSTSQSKEGSLGIGTTATPSTTLDVNGNVMAPLYYDSDSTDYFLNPASTGIGLNTQGTIYSEGTGNNYFNGRIYQTGLGYSTFFGYEAGKNDDLSNNYNTAFGYQALNANTSGNTNTAIGYRTLYSNTTGYQNTAVGVSSLRNNTTGSNNTAFGYASLISNTSGIDNVALGHQSLYHNDTGNDNTAVGFASLQNNTAGNYNSALGYQALVSNTSGNRNVAVGMLALKTNTTGSNNTAIGYEALYKNDTGNHNTATGIYALLSNTTGSNNTANGAYALYYNTTGSNNTATGYLSLERNTTGNSNTATGLQALYYNTSGNYNTANGMYALLSNTSGNYNTATGMYALYHNTTGSNNTAIGYQSLRANTTGTENTTSGFDSLKYNTTGIYNTATGYRALLSNTTGNFNTAIGHGALYNVKPTSGAITAFADYSGTVAGTVKVTSASHGLTGSVSSIRISGTTNYNGVYTITVIDADNFYFTHSFDGDDATGWWGKDTEGRYNTAIGYQAGDNITTGSNNIVIGHNVDAPSATGDNQLNIGNAIYGNLSSGYVGIGTTNPGAKLEVVTNTAGSVENIQLQNAENNAIWEFRVGGSSSSLGDGSFAITDSGASNTRFLIQSNGNVGIGTTNPGAKLDVMSGTQKGIRLDVDGADPQETYIRLFNNLAGVGDASTGIQFTSDSFSKPMARINSGWEGSTSDAFISFSTTNDDGATLPERMRINKDGNVGIGTTSPEEKLDVNGRVKLAQTTAPGTTTDKLYNVSGNLYWNGTDLTGGGSLPGATEGYTLRGNGSDWQATSNLFVDSSGEVGIGTTAPDTFLHVYKANTVSRTSVTDIITLDSLASGVGGIGYDGFGTGLVFQGRTYQESKVRPLSRISSIQRGNSANNFGNAILFETIEQSTSIAPREVMRIEYNGNVGIGTTNPGAPLDVNGNIQASAYYDSDNTDYFLNPASTGVGLNTQGTIYSEGTGDNYFNGRIYQTGLGYSTFFGYEAGKNDDLSDNRNTAFGYQALNANTSGSYNTAFGYKSLIANTEGNYNIAYGYYALDSNTTGSYNIAIGYQALHSNQTGNSSIAIGKQALRANSTGVNNTAIGTGALYANTEGSYNTGIGVNALLANTTGQQNVGIGYYAGRYIADGSTKNETSLKSVYVGVLTKALADGDTNEIVIGHNTTGSGSNTVTLGNTDITKTILRGNVGIGTTNPGIDLAIGDSDTGLQQQGDGQLAIYANNSEKVRITSGGYVGIGTTNPNYKLDERGGIAYFNRNDGNDGFVTSALIPINVVNHTPSETSPNREMRLIQWKDASSYGGGISWGMAPAGTTQWYAGAYSTGQYFLFYDGAKLKLQGSHQSPGSSPNLFTPSDFITLTNIGNVGIGTTNPGQELTVNGQMAFGANLGDVISLYDNRIGATDMYGLGVETNYMYFKTNSGYRWYSGTNADAGASDIMELQSNGNLIIPNGNVGIGTTNPGIDLAIGDSDTGLQQQGDGQLAIYANNSEKVRITSGGYVGIGTTNPGAKLDVQGQISGGFGAQTTSGTLDWNDASNARPGNGYSLLLGTATNGPGGGVYYHPFSFEYGPGGSIGNLTQFAIPYNSSSLNNGIYLRTRYSGTWTNWTRIISENTSGNVGIGTTAPQTSLDVVGTIQIRDVVGAGTFQTNKDFPRIYNSSTETGSTYPFDRNGNLIIQPRTSADSDIVFAVGTTPTVKMMIDGTNGNVGIGTTNPGYKLEVNGDLSVGDNKIYAGSIDPVYEIDGVHYATYGQSMVGLKEETVGKVELKLADNKQQGVYSYEIDFNKVKKGSNLWLFKQITDFGKNWKDLIVILTPEGRAQVWYKLLPKQNKIIIFADHPVVASYRLVAPRFDHPDQETNLSDVKDWGIFVK